MEYSTPGFPVHHQLGACSNSCPSSRWCHPTISSSVVPFSCLQSFPASQSFPMCLTFIEYCLFLASVTVIQSISYSFISNSFAVSSPSLNENPFPLLMYSFLFKLVSVLGLSLSFVCWWLSFFHMKLASGFQAHTSTQLLGSSTWIP